MKTALLRILLPYVVFASLWILLSDWLLGAMLADPALVTQWSMYKGLAFVLITTLLLYALLRRELGARQRAEETGRQNQSLLSAVSEGSSDAVFVKDAQGHYLIVNTAALHMMDTTREEVLGKDDTELFPADEASRLMADDHRIMGLGITQTYEERLSLGGQAVFFHTTKGPVRNAQDKVIGLFGIAHDITARKRSENELHRINRTLKTLSECNHALVRATSETELFEAICRIVTEHGGYRMAWVGFAENDEKKSVRPVAQAGFEAGYLFTVDISWADVERGRGPTGTAIRTGLPVISRNITTDPALAPWREAAIRRGYASSIALPLMVDGRAVGAFTLYAAEPEAFDTAEVALLGELAEDLAYGLAALRTQLERDRLFNLSLDLMCVAGFDGYLKQVNPAWTQTLGWSEAELLGRVWLEFVHPDDLAVTRQAGVELVAGRRVIGFENRYQHKDGSYRWLSWNSFPLADAGMIFAVVRDITAHKQAVVALQESETRFRSLVEAAPEGIFIQSENRFVYVNEAMFRLFGAARGDDLLGMHILERIAPEYREAVRNRIQFQLETGKALPLMDQEYLRLDGSRIWTETTAIATKHQGRDARLVFVRDITARKQAEAARELLQAQLLQAQKMESLGRLAGGVAHDFNNQLQAILGFAELLQPDLQASQRENLEEIGRAAQRAADLTRQLLAFSRKQMFTPRVLNVNEVVTGAQKMLHRLLGEDIRIEAQLALPLKAIHADPGQIEQVIVNLAVNARDAMPAGGRLTISTAGLALDAQDAKADPEARPGEFVCLAVSDTGTGISQEILNKIFEPFFTTKGPGKGTGLGLAVIYGIVKQHNGWIHVDSVVGQGTTFKIYLPVYGGKESTENVPVVAAGEGNLGHGERILLVEDEPGVRTIAIRVLEQAGYVIVAAANAAEARAAFEQHAGHFALIFSDVVLPDQNGILLSEELLDRQPGLPVLLCSGYTDERSCWSAIEKKGFRFIGKPYPSATLLATIRQILDTHPPGGQP
jgi:PAS domain S-box-containing protein